jgi:hypothetical protein
MDKDHPADKEHPADKDHPADKNRPAKTNSNEGYHHEPPHTIPPGLTTLMKQVPAYRDVLAFSRDQGSGNEPHSSSVFVQVFQFLTGRPE